MHSALACVPSRPPPPQALLWRMSPQHVCLFVMECRCCASIFLNPNALPCPPFSPATTLQSLHPQTSRLGAKRGWVRAVSQARFMTPSVLQSGRTPLMWWMEWQVRRLHNHPREIKYGCPFLCARELGGLRLKGNRRKILGCIQPFTRLSQG